MEIDPNQVRAQRKRMICSQNRISSVEFIRSENCDARPPGMDIDTLVIHAISLPPGKFGGGYVEQLFINRLDPKEDPYFESIHQLRVSAHGLIRRDGRFVQFVPFNLRAWHAGESMLDGRAACNDFSIGIELEGCDTQAFTQAQYVSLIALTLNLFDAYPKLAWSRVVGHSQIAPGRKTDPGPHFDWQLYGKWVNTV